MSPHKPERAERGRQASVTGFANEHIVVGLLMKTYSNVSLVDLPLSSFDIVLVREVDGKEGFTRIQVKTATKSVSFTGGSRGGVDREYNKKTNVSKTYRQSQETSDVVVGVHQNEDESFDMYFILTILIEKWNKGSVSLKKISVLRNNFSFLEHCKDESWVLSKAQEHGLA